MLAEVEAARAELARRAVAPLWYHPALGLLTGGLVAVQGTQLSFVGAYYAAFSIGLVMLVGLLGKNAVLIVEFAVQTRHEGATVFEAALQGQGGFV